MAHRYAGWFVLLVAITPASAAERFVTERLHHLRVGGNREWSEFPPQAEASRLQLSFDAEKNAAEATLRLCQQDVKQVWKVRVNQTDVGKLLQDENDTVLFLPLPPGTLRTGANVLSIEQVGRAADDIRVGQIAIDPRRRSDVLTEATVRVTVRDATGAGAPVLTPCRITVVDSSGALATTGAVSTGDLGVRPGVIYTSKGEAEFGLAAGEYTIYAGRGVEYGIDSARISVKPGDRVEKQLTIRREFSTAGYISCDPHIHTLTYSGHGDATIGERVLTIAGEGIELPIATEHNRHVDYDAAARKHGVRQYFTPVVGNEVTTAVGHFNIFPVLAGGPAPDFNLKNGPAIFKSIAERTAAGAIILNHPRDIHSGFRPFGPQRHNAVTGQNADDWLLRASAVEVVNSGAQQTDPLKPFRDWFALLNRGALLTPVGASDSHDVSRYIVGQARTYIRCADHDPGMVPVKNAVESFLAGKVLVSCGLFTEIRVNGRYSAGDIAPRSEAVEVEVRVLGPGWVTAERVALYANGIEVHQAKITEGNRAGVKWSGTWKLPPRNQDVHLAAIATGPPVEQLYWPIAKPYQPTSPEVRKQVIGATGAVWVDGDGDGERTSAFEYAKRLWFKSDHQPQRFVSTLAEYDEAVASQAAGLLVAGGVALDETALQAAANKAGPHVERGFRAFLEAWREMKIAGEAQDAKPLSSSKLETLEQRLIKEGPAALARAARRQGDAARGALIFYQQSLACAKCHATGEPGGPLIGPDLTKPGNGTDDVYLVESVLRPSKVIRQGFASISIATRDAETISGLLVEERDDVLTIRDMVRPADLIEIPKNTIANRRPSEVSLMPDGLVANFSDRQQFLDLVRYLIEIAEHGPPRADQLRPPAALFTAVPLPDYEHRVNHAGMIASLDRASLKQGEAIYLRVCANCHGTHKQAGSLPTSLRFADGQFKNGSDPYRMYQTITHGFGMMAPQPWMVPEQKYDVIHYIREAYLKPHNPTQYARIDKRYLDRLPKGDTRGPAPVNIEPWANMDYGPTFNATLEVGDSNKNFAYKGIAVRLDAGPGGVSKGRHWMLYDHDTLRMAAAWSGNGFIDWNGINFNGRHEVHPRIVGAISVASTGLGWANPKTGSFADERVWGRDGRRYGPLPRDWARYKGLYHFGQQTVLSYSIGDAAILESPGYEMDRTADGPLFTRTLDIGRSNHDLLMRVSDGETPVAVVGNTRVERIDRDNATLLRIPADATPLSFKVRLSARTDTTERSNPQSLRSLIRGGPKRWPESLVTQMVAGKSGGPFAVETLAHPDQNPWSCQMRFTGFDFEPNGHVVLCTWDGDVWRVAGLDQPDGKLVWRRIASGLFQPLGLKIVGERIYVSCRDQIVVLHDLNGDGETDFYENFNSDHQVTEHFHEFAMGLQTDAAGNFYYAKSARHGRPAVVPHHGTLLRVSPDGARTDIIATGFRAANGVCVNPDGSYFVTDQEGHWNPKNRINHVTAGGFFGNMWGYHDVTDPSDRAMRQPLCWITNSFDRSPAELLWVDRGAWGPLQGALLSLSYGNGKVFSVLHETVGGRLQGGLCELPIPAFPTGILRGRFHPVDGCLYLCGMYAWAGNQQQPGGFYRVRSTGKPVHVPTGLSAHRHGINLTFSAPLDATAASRVENYRVRTWSLKRTENYGSPHDDEKELKVAKAALFEDRKTVRLEIPEIRPTWGMEIRYYLASQDGTPVRGVIHNTIHQLGD
jgi:putative heme-binding domain-containing protein